MASGKRIEACIAEPNIMAAGPISPRLCPSDRYNAVGSLAPRSGFSEDKRVNVSINDSRLSLAASANSSTPSGSPPIASTKREYISASGKVSPNGSKIGCRIWK